MHRMFSHLDTRMMLQQFALLVCLSIRLINAFDTPSETIVDLYHKINSYGSLSKATSFIPSVQTKLKSINTVRVVLYAGQLNKNSKSIFQQKKKHQIDKFLFLFSQSKSFIADNSN